MAGSGEAVVGGHGRAEAALEDREAFIQSIGDNLPDGMIYQLVRRPDGSRRFTYLSDAVRRLHGCSPEEAIADPGRVYGTVAREDWQRVFEEEERANANLAIFRTEARIIDPSGGVRWSAFASRPRRLADGSTCWDGVELDITERKRIEEALRRSEEAYRTVSHLTSDFVFRVDAAPDGRLRMSLGSAGFFGEGGGPASGPLTPEHWAGALHEEDASRFLELLRRLVSEGGQAEFEGRSRTANGQVRWLHVTAEALREGREGRTTAVLGAVADVTARRNAEAQGKALQDQLLAVNRELESALRLKDEFLSSMSHELRTPLNAILGFVQALTDQVYGATNDRMLRAAAVTEEAGRHLLAMINDILDLSKIQAGKLGLELGPVPVRSLCDASLQLLEKEARRKRIELVLSHEPAVATLTADGRRVKQILVNLLANAVKFTPEGGRVELSVTGDPDAGVVRLSVSDNGIGIAEDQLPRLFQPFTQVDSRLARPHSGTGLGLSLVLNLATLHGGGIEVRSRPGGGSRFTVSLPWHRTPEALGARGEGNGAATAPPAALEGSEPLATPGRTPARVLIVEDNEASALLLSDYLSSRAYLCSVAPSALEAIRLARSERPDIVLMDIQMPGMDGLEAIRRIRAEEERTRTPILAVTALAMPGDRERCLSAGADGYLAKPLDLPGLVRTIEGLLRRTDMEA